MTSLQLAGCATFEAVTAPAYREDRRAWLRLRAGVDEAGHRCMHVLRRDVAGYRPTGASELLAVDAATLEASITWPSP